MAGWIAGAMVVGSLASAASSNSASKRAASASRDAIAQAGSQAELEAQTAKDALDWYKTQYYDQAPLRDLAARKATEVSDAQLRSMGLQDAISKDYWDYQKNTFRPLEAGIVADAQGYDTEARREAAAGRGLADVETSLAAQRGATTREMERKGVNPASGAALALSNQMDLGSAAIKAKTANDARTQVETMGLARKMDAANLGRNLASNQATSAGLALNAGNSAVTNAGVPVAQAQSASNAAGQGFNTAIQGANGAGNLYATIGGLNNSIANQQSQQSNNIWGALGSVAGRYAGSQAGSTALSNFITSDKNKKKNVKPQSGTMSLAAFRKMPVSKWDYKKGAGDGGHHVGPMAQDVRKGLGDATAPGGKVIDLISMSGHTVSAIKELDKRLMTLESARPKYSTKRKG